MPAGAAGSAATWHRLAPPAHRRQRRCCFGGSGGKGSAPGAARWVLAGQEELLSTKSVSLGLLGRLNDVHKLGLEGGAAHLCGSGKEAQRHGVWMEMAC